jgi:hypothetical protein
MASAREAREAFFSSLGQAAPVALLAGGGYATGVLSGPVAAAVFLLLFCLRKVVHVAAGCCYSSCQLAAGISLCVACKPCYYMYRIAASRALDSRPWAVIEPAMPGVRVCIERGGSEARWQAGARCAPRSATGWGLSWAPLCHLELVLDHRPPQITLTNVVTGETGQLLDWVQKGVPTLVDFYQSF